jgi:hypothetical protein
VATIVVEARCDPNSRPILDALAAAGAALGHDVTGWRGPLSGRVPHGRRLKRCDLAILFNGAHPAYDRPLRRLHRWNTPLLFVELGWYPQLGTFQLDSVGINAAASWVNEPLTAVARTTLPVRPDGDLLVLLQHDSDTQITALSPWFADMRKFVEHLCRHSALPLRVRAHPRHPPDDSLVQLVRLCGGRMEAGRSLSESFRDCRAVACINSSGAVEAMAAGLAVLCYGYAIYRHSGAVYCLDNDGEQTRRVTAALARGESHLHVESIQEVLDRIEARQWRLEQIPARLPSVLVAVINQQSPQTVVGRRRWPLILRRAG